MANKARKDIQEIELQTRLQAAELERDRLKNWSENLQQQVYELQSRTMALALQIKRLETAATHEKGHKHQPHTSQQQLAHKVFSHDLSIVGSYLAPNGRSPNWSTKLNN